MSTQNLTKDLLDRTLAMAVAGQTPEESTFVSSNEALNAFMGKKESLRTGGLAAPTTTLESMGAAGRTTFAKSLSALVASFETLTLGADYKTTAAQRTVAALVAPWCATPDAIAKSLKTDKTSMMVARESMFVGGDTKTAAPVVRTSMQASMVMGANLTTPMKRLEKGTMESFDPQKHTGNMPMVTLAFNFFASKQVPAMEMVFPTVPVPHDSAGYTVMVDLMFLTREVRHATTGAQTDFHRINLLHAWRDTSILDSDHTRAIPILRTGNDGNETRFLVTAGAGVNLQTTHKVGGVDEPTAPLKADVVHNYLGLSQTDALLQRGVFNNTDMLDARGQLEKIYLLATGTVGGQAVSEIFSIDVTTIPSSYYYQSVIGNTEKQQLTFSTQSLLFTKDTKQVGGAASQLMPSIIGEHDVRVSLDLNGYFLCDKGEGQVQSNAPRVASIYAAGQQAVSDAGIETLITNMKFVAYDLLQYRTNRNRRQIGSLVDGQTVLMNVTVPYRSPVSALRPDGNDDGSDTQRVNELLAVVQAQITASGVSELLSMAGKAKQFRSTGKEPLWMTPEVMGAQSYFLRPAVYDQEFDLLTCVDSPNTGDRAQQAKVGFVNKLREVMVGLYIDSGLMNALQTYYQGQPPKLTVQVVTDPHIATYLQLDGDLRTLSEQFNIQVEAVSDIRMVGRIIATFGLPEASNGGVPNIMHSGNFLYRPEIVLNNPTTRDGSYRQELVVVPSYRHILHSPIVADFAVTNLDRVMTQKNITYMKAL